MAKEVSMCTVRNISWNFLEITLELMINYTLLNSIATSTMEPSKTNWEHSQCSATSRLLLPYSKKTPMATNHGLRRNRSNTYVSFFAILLTATFHDYITDAHVFPGLRNR